ncbi:hypothetical protein TNCV_2033991 [Trichonephila clavipes]|nr:hypothetical protein TNCV_2033991 [Trichonephila clavipes]
MEWRSPASPRGKKVRAENTRIKTMLFILTEVKTLSTRNFYLRERRWMLRAPYCVGKYGTKLVGLKTMFNQTILVRSS